MAEPPHPNEFNTYVPPPESMDNSLFEFEELSPHCTKITLTISDENDLNRLCLKSDVSYLTFPDLGIEEGEGTALFGTVSKVLSDATIRLTRSLDFFSPTSVQYDAIKKHLTTLESASEGQNLPFRIEILDPTSQSFVSLAPGSKYAKISEDPAVVIEHSSRTWQQICDLGIQDQFIPEEKYVVEEREREGEDFNAAVDKFVELINNASRIVIFSGAGVSTESNLPAYRTVGALDNIWDKNAESDGHINNFLSDPECRKRYWRMHLDFAKLMLKAEPNPAHLIATHLQECGKLLGVVTQNIDGLYLKAGIEESKLLELHGYCREISCLDCSQIVDYPSIFELYEKGEAIVCPKCGGLLKPKTVFFGQALDPAILQQATYFHKNCDLLIVMASALVVQPANQLPGYALSNNTPLIICNIGETKYDDYATVLFNNQYVGALSQHILNKLKL